MRRSVVLVVVVLLLLVGLVPVAFAANQPSQGEHSTGRNEAGFGEGPHCHVLIVDSAQQQFVIRTFPSHQGHASSGVGHVFAADVDCDGAP
jgi:hypothetical protein